METAADEDDNMMDIRVPLGMFLLEDNNNDNDGGNANENILIQTSQPTKMAPQKLAKNLVADNQAIVDCWNLTVASHEAIVAGLSVSDATTEAKRRKNTDKQVQPQSPACQAVMIASILWRINLCCFGFK
eukprot:jgi/Psemu1/25368/gm1.25368_g